MVGGTWQGAISNHPGDKSRVGNCRQAERPAIKQSSNHIIDDLDLFTADIINQYIRYIKKIRYTVSLQTIIIIIVAFEDSDSFILYTAVEH